MDALTEPFSLPFMQRALVEVLLLAVAGGLLGAWIVLRRLAFYTHAVGTATFPGLVVAGPWGIAPQLAALGAALLFAALLERVARARRLAPDAATGLLLVGALAAGALLASDVYHSGAGVDRLLFGTLIGLGPGDVRLAAVVAGLALAATAALGRSWLAGGFDPGTARALGVRTAVADLLLLAGIAGAVVAALSAVGALLVSALFVVPAATVRPFAGSVRTLQAGAVALAAAEGVVGLWLAYELNAPPGATIAVLGGVVFALAALVRAASARRVGAGALAVLALVVAAGCGGGSSKDDDEPDAPKVIAVATTTQVADLVRQVGGPRVQVTRLLGPNVDPHEYEPRPADAKALVDADVVFRSGGDVDDWLDALVKNVGGDVAAVDVGKSVVLREVDGKVDPHWWQDPRNVVAAVLKIRDELVKFDKRGSRPYRRRADAYLQQVRGLDGALERCFARVPPRQRALVTDHDAFGYLAARYGLRVVGAAIPSLSTQAQASAGETAALVRKIRQEGVKAVFSERSVNSGLERNIARASGARVIDSLYGDTLGPPGSPGATWLKAMRFNGATIASGITGGAVRCRLPT